MAALEKYGADIQNKFGLLNDRLNRVRPPKLREFLGDEYTAEEVAKKIGKSRPSMYKPEIQLSKDFIEKYLIPVVISSDLAIKLFNNKKEDARLWMLTPNSFFFGKSPFNLCLLGDGKEVISFLRERLGK
ncbi:MAG: hypothetical protein KBD78_16425 [Oligoflexales bacterium]|nr:hypothetical protein [Oligoflexales bacterium]